MEGEVEVIYLCHFLKVFMPLLQGSSSVQGLSHTCVFAEEGLAVVFYPVQHLCSETTGYRRLRKQHSHEGAL